MDHDPDDHPEVPGHRLLHVIGAGSSSVVWAGSTRAGDPVAIKVPRAHPDPVSQREAQIERQVLLGVRHDHLVSLRDVVALADGRVALVFDLVVGATLASLVASRGHLRPGEVVTVLSPIAEAVAALHAAGGTHCDISPGNIMLTADGRPLLMDLGAARIAGTGGGAVVGTPGFVAPEVRSGEPPTEASDVFSLGAVAWFCLTGNGAPDTFLRLSDETVISHTGPDLAGVIGRCIDPEPEVRPSSAQLPRLVFDAVAREPLEVVVGADQASALTHRIRAEAAGAQPPTPDRPRPWFRRRPAARPAWAGRVVAAGTVIALAAVLAWLVHLGLVPGTGTRAPTAPIAGGGTGAVSTATGLPPAPAARPADPRVILQQLTDRRVAALLERRADALAAVHRRGSPSWQADAAVIDALTSGHQRYAGLQMTVIEAAFVTRSEVRAVVRARVAVGAYRVADDDGGVVPRGGEAGEPLDFHLVHGDDGWRIESVSSPKPT